MAHFVIVLEFLPPFNALWYGSTDTVLTKYARYRSEEIDLPILVVAVS